MDGDKDDKSLIEKAIESIKDIASSVTEVVKSAPPSARAEMGTAEEDFDSPPMTAEELAHHAAADTQPAIPEKKATRNKTATPSLSGRVTPTYDFPPPDSPMPSFEKRKAAVKKTKKSAKTAKKKTAKPADKKSTAKKAVKKTAPRKSKKAVNTTYKKSSKKKSKKTKR
jgi:colicin import membrane protein